MSALKKILVVGKKSSGKLTFLEKLTGSLPGEIPRDSHGGVTHELQIKNKYYEAQIGIWVDEFDETGVQEFVTSYCSDEAAEVRAIIGVLVVTFCKDQSKESVSQLLDSIKSVVDLCSPEALVLAVGKSGRSEHKEEESDAAWDDLCLDEGFEYIDLEATGKNTFGEHTGVERVKGAIGACDWSAAAMDPSEEELLASMMAEDTAMNKHLLDEDFESQGTNFEEASVEELEKMMQRVMMARGAPALY